MQPFFTKTRLTSPKPHSYRREMRLVGDTGCISQHLPSKIHGCDASRHVTSAHGAQRNDVMCLRSAQSQCSLNNGSVRHSGVKAKAGRCGCMRQLPSVGMSPWQARVGRNDHRMPVGDNRGNTSCSVSHKHSMTSFKSGNMSSRVSKRTVKKQRRHTLLDYLLTPVKYLLGRK